MSKYIKLEDIKNAFIELSESGKCLRRTTTMNIIKALNNLPRIEVSEDCISREYMLEKAQEWKNMYSDNVFARDALTMLKIEIENAPSVVPKEQRNDI